MASYFPRTPIWPKRRLELIMIYGGLTPSLLASTTRPIPDPGLSGFGQTSDRDFDVSQHAGR